MHAHHYYHRATLKKDQEFNERVRSKLYRIEEDIRCRPGQYLMLWLPTRGEIPLSPSKCGEGLVEFLVEDVGPTSSAIVRSAIGEISFIRGPFGSSFNTDLDGPYVLIAGGTGIAPLFMALSELRQKGKEVHMICGGTSKDRIYYIEELRSTADSIGFTTEDGSFGRRGIVTDLAEELIVEKRARVLLTTGPEKMMKEALKIAARHGLYCEASIVRIVKCGEGVCGSCVLDPLGVLTCKEGTVLPGSILLKTEFGSTMRDGYGRKVPIP